jgi:hypothetical protein
LGALFLIDLVGFFLFPGHCAHGALLQAYTAALACLLVDLITKEAGAFMCRAVLFSDMLLIFPLYHCLCFSLPTRTLSRIIAEVSPVASAPNS